MCCCIRCAGNDCAIVFRSGYIRIWSGARDQESTNHSSRFVEWKSRYITTWIIKTEVWVICRNRRLKQIKQTWGLVFHEIFQFNGNDNVNGPLTQLRFIGPIRTNCKEAKESDQLAFYSAQPRNWTVSFLLFLLFSKLCTVLVSTNWV